ncbi:MAG: deacetylase [Clostridiales bacterium]|nr:deacetylase [Clostridiales bacterium]
MVFAVLKKKKILTALIMAVIFFISLITLSKTGTYQVFYGATMRKLPIYRVQTEEKKLAISFDCAWGVDYTDKLLEIMQEEKVKCTFFMVEFWTTKHPDYVKKIFDAGHELGTHSATHPYMSKLSKSQIERELISSSQAIESITGKKVEVFRPPYGDYDDLLIETANNLGLYTIQWDVDSLDWKDLTKDQIYDRVVKRVKNGSIVLFHNQGLHTAEALGEIIKKLKSDGYTFVSIGELIYRDNYKILPDGSQIAQS